MSCPLCLSPVRAYRRPWGAGTCSADWHDGLDGSGNPAVKEEQADGDDEGGEDHEESEGPEEGPVFVPHPGTVSSGDA